MLKLSKRLQAVCEMVDMGAYIIDVGTDHGYVPISLVGQGRAIRAIAADKNKGPLCICEKNIGDACLEDKIKTVLSDGLLNVDTDGFNTTIIAGMGGMTIIDILKASPNKLTNTLILQPQKDSSGVRRYIHKLGYRIADEALIYEDMFYYVIIKAIFGNDIFYDDNAYKYGSILISKKDSVLKQKLLEDLEKLRLLSLRISSDNAKRISEIREEMDSIRELLDRF